MAGLEIRAVTALQCPQVVPDPHRAVRICVKCDFMYHPAPNILIAHDPPLGRGTGEWRQRQLRLVGPNAAPPEGVPFAIPAIRISTRQSGAAGLVGEAFVPAWTSSLARHELRNQDKAIAPPHAERRIP
mmetsp:Transcript_45909/g.107316  ORF Transcript_45909/g.107316 Transcript_45909/m.107316 type:complete len:129 (-) Transcript_45909:13-399(-)